MPAFIAGIVLITCMISTFSYVMKQNGSKEPAEEVYLSLGVVNNDTSEYARLLISYFKDNPEFTEYISVTEGEETALKEQFSKGELDCLLVIPEGFAEQMMLMEHLPIEVLISTKHPTKALLLKTALDGYETYIRAVEVNCAALYDKMKADGFSYEERQQANVDISMELIFTALGKDSFFTEREVEGEGELSLAAGYLYSLFWFGMLFLYFPAGNKLRRFFEKGLAQRMFVSQISKGTLLFAVVLPYVLLTLACAAIPALSGTGNGLLFWLMTVSLLLPMLLFTTLLGILCKNGRSYLFVYSMLLLGMALLGGSLVPVLYLPDEFLLVTKWLPNYQFLRLAGETVTASKVAGTAAVAGGLCAALCILLFAAMKHRGEERQYA